MYEYVSVWFPGLEIDSSEHADRREALSSMLTSGHTSFKLTVVSEPIADEGAEEADEECIEIGKDCSYCVINNVEELTQYGWLIVVTRPCTRDDGDTVPRTMELQQCAGEPGKDGGHFHTT